MKKILLFLPVWIQLLLVACKPAVRPQLGFIYHSDGTFSCVADSARQPLGVVFAMGVAADSSWCYVLSLQEYHLPLTTVRSVLPGEVSPDSLCGLANTRAWIEALGEESPMLNRLRAMGEEWFIPSIGEWRLLRTHYDKVYAMLDTITGSCQIGMNNYWTSTPEPDTRYPHYGIAYDLYGDRYASYNKSEPCLARFMVRVKLEK